MTYTFASWARAVEDPVGAAIRADVTAGRHVIDAAHDYQTAKAQGDGNQIAATKAAFRQAWETDVRRRGGKPEDFIPDYINVDLVPVVAPPPPSPWWPFGQLDTQQNQLIKLMSTMAIFYIIWTFLK